MKITKKARTEILDSVSATFSIIRKEKWGELSHKRVELWPPGEYNRVLEMAQVERRVMKCLSGKLCAMSVTAPRKKKPQAPCGV